jgi:hypothetical protein
LSVEDFVHVLSVRLSVNLSDVLHPFYIVILQLPALTNHASIPDDRFHTILLRIFFYLFNIPNYDRYYHSAILPLPQVVDGLTFQDSLRVF